MSPLKSFMVKGKANKASIELSRFYCDLTVGKSALSIESVLIRNNTDTAINETLVIKCREVIGQYIDNSGINHSLCVPLETITVSCKPGKEMLTRLSSKWFEINQTTERLTFFLQEPDDEFLDKSCNIKCQMLIHLSVKRIQ